jgi:hypothetical protein
LTGVRSPGKGRLREEHAASRSIGPALPGNGAAAIGAPSPRCAAAKFPAPSSTCCTAACSMICSLSLGSGAHRSGEGSLQPHAAQAEALASSRRGARAARTKHTIAPLWNGNFSLLTALAKYGEVRETRLFLSSWRNITSPTRKRISLRSRCSTCHRRRRCFSPRIPPTWMQGGNADCKPDSPTGRRNTARDT